MLRFIVLSFIYVVGGSPVLGTPRQVEHDGQP